MEAKIILGINDIELEFFELIKPQIRKRSVKNENSFRVVMAKRQLKKYEEMKISSEEMRCKIITTVKIVLGKLGMELPDDYNCVIELRDKNIDYKTILGRFDLNEDDDIVWIKLNKNGCISVVGTSQDISFDEDTKNNTSSGKING